MSSQSYHYSGPTSYSRLRHLLVILSISHLACFALCLLLLASRPLAVPPASLCLLQLDRALPSGEALVKFLLLYDLHICDTSYSIALSCL